MGDSRKFSRRRFLQISATTTAAGFVAACAAPSQPASPTTAPAAPTAAPAAATAAPAAATAVPAAATAAPAATSGFKEAPMLAELVKAGTLPPVAERLPAKPMVVTPLEGVGAYGGTWRMGMEEDDGLTISKSTLYEGLVRWNAEWTEVEPNIAESWEVIDDGKKYVFKIREGIKWSDGKPFSAADIHFWAKEIRGNEDLHGDMPSWMQVEVDGEDVDAEVELVDDNTISFSWPQPNGLFLQRMATPDGLELTHYQAEYAKTWLLPFNPDVEKQAAEEQLPSWIELWDAKVGYSYGGINSRNQNPDLPSLNPWIFPKKLGEGQVFMGERNPYYWKVDTDGQQLPYIDKLQFQLVTDREVLVLQALNGEIDLQDRRVGGVRNRQVLAEGREKGGYDFFDVVADNMNDLIISLNLSHKDPVKREVYGNKKFRQALSVAIDRDELNQIILFGLSQPHQGAPRPEAGLYDETFATQFTEYNPDQAKTWLDELGYKPGADGFRAGPDGNTINIVIESDSPRDPADLIIKKWAEVGIKATFSQVERSLFRERTGNNDHDATAWPGNSGLDTNVVLSPFFYMPFGRESHFGMGWLEWSTDPEGELAVEPPDPIKKQLEIYAQIKQTADATKQRELMKQILDIARDEFLVIGTLLPLNTYGIVKNNMINVPDTMFASTEWPQPSAARPEQFAFKPS
jgi:peptide/nickel transport system substrate-binding protein